MSDFQQDVEQVEVTPVVSLPGERLRTTREAGRMSRDEVAQHLHLDVQIIIALEQDNYQKLPSPMYVCGYLRSYARLLKLPETEIVAAYTKGKVIDAALIPENVNILPGKKPINPAIIKTIVLLLLGVLIAAGLIWLTEETDLFKTAVNGDKKVEVPLVVPESTEPPVSESVATTADSETQDIQELVPPTVQEIEQKIAQQESTVAEQTQPIINDAVASGDLRLVATEDSWVEITDSDTVRHVYRLMRAGSEIVVAGKAPYKILLGKASGVEVFYKDRVFDHSRFHRDEVAYFRIGVTE